MTTRPGASDGCGIAGNGRNSAPRGLSWASRQPRLAEMTHELGLPLERLAQPVEVRMAWCPVPLWFVPDDLAAERLVADGISRGRVLTVVELAALLAIPGLTTAGARRLALAKLGVDGALTRVRRAAPAEAPRTTRRGDAGVDDPRIGNGRDGGSRRRRGSPHVRRVRLPPVGEPPVTASPWPDALLGLGPRGVVAFAACEDCRDAGGRTLRADAPDGTKYEIARNWAPGTWSAYGGRPLCLSCAQARGRS